MEPVISMECEYFMFQSEVVFLFQSTLECRVAFHPRSPSFALVRPRSPSQHVTRSLDLLRGLHHNESVGSEQAIHHLRTKEVRQCVV